MPTIRKNMADINSSDQALNGLKVKTDSLPDDWYVILVNPKNGEPGENMSIARFLELLKIKIGVASMDKYGFAEKCQGKTFYSLKPEEFIDIHIDNYGLYMFVSETFHGTSLLFQAAYSVYDFRIVSDLSGIQGRLFKIEKLEDGDKNIRVTNLSSSNIQNFSLNRL